MNPVRWLIVLLACAMSLGCQDSGRPAAKPAPADSTPPPIADPNCIERDVTRCPPMMEMVATDAPLVLEEYGIFAHFPVGARACYGLSGAHAHGFYARLGEARAECYAGKDAPKASTIGIWADYNAAFLTSLDQAVGDDCVARRPDVDLNRPDGRPFSLRGLPSRVCIEDDGEGGFMIAVTAMAGRWEGDGGVMVPRLIYRAYLSTRPATVEADKVVFARFLDALRLTALAPPDKSDEPCSWRRGTLYAANGSPSLRVRLPTGRVLGVTSDFGDEAEAALPDAAWTAIKSRGDVYLTEVAGEWRVCPLAPDRAGWMRPVHLIDARDMVVTTR